MSKLVTMANAVLSDMEKTYEKRVQLYKEFHQIPELSMQEYETSKKIKELVKVMGLEPIEVGKTGVAVVLENGEGAKVALRADIDGLPMAEHSGKAYESDAKQTDEKTGNTTPVAHSCGHDVHIMGLIGALEAFNSHKDVWSGTLIAIFQPGEECSGGAQSMIDNGLKDKIPLPDVYFGQHVLGVIPGAHVGTKPGAVFTTALSIKIKLFAKGSHGSMPHLGIDPIVLAAHIILRLQFIVSREINPNEMAVITVGRIDAGTKSNIIPDDATLYLNTHAYNQDVADKLHASIERVVKGECEASGCLKAPEIEYYDEYPLTLNDDEAYEQVSSAFDEYFGERHLKLPTQTASEDFSIIPDALGVPYCYCGIGGFKDYENAPGKHNPAFAPDIECSLDTGMESLVVAACSSFVRDIQE